MWTMPPAVLAAGAGNWSPGTLIAELLFESFASGDPVNTGTLGGTFTLGNFGTGFSPSFNGSGGVGGGGYCVFPNLFNAKGVLARNSAGSSFIIGTADFEIQAYLRLSTYTVQFFQTLWNWTNGSPSPRLYVQKDTGALYFADDVVTDQPTGYTIPIDSTWRKYALRRQAGDVYVLVDDVVQFSMPYTADCNAGFSGSFYVGVTWNGGGGLRAADMDEFRFYNGNV